MDFAAPPAYFTHPPAETKGKGDRSGRTQSGPPDRVADSNA